MKQGTVCISTDEYLRLLDAGEDHKSRADKRISEAVAVEMKAVKQLQEYKDALKEGIEPIVIEQMPHPRIYTHDQILAYTRDKCITTLQSKITMLQDSNRVLREQLEEKQSRRWWK